MRVLVAILAVLALVLSIWRMEADRAGLSITALDLPGAPPATLYSRPDAPPGPVVVVAHGFAGSRPLMEPFALSLARAGYRVVSYDLLGHGRNPVPMSGDVTRIDGTTRLLVAEALAVSQAALAVPGSDGRLGWLGHSMASDIVIRAALEAPVTGAVVAVSAFSQAVTADAPRNLLLVVGDWETRLKAEALSMLALAAPGAGPGQTVGEPAAGTGRRAVFAPGEEHVGVLYSATAQAEAVAWFDAAFGRASVPEPSRRGIWIVVMLAALTALAWPLVRALPAGPAPAPLPRRLVLMATLAPAVLAPLVLAPLRLDWLPVLVADDLAAHFALMGGLSLAILARAGALHGLFGARAGVVAAGVALFGIVVFGGLTDRYIANFIPHAGRLAVILGLLPGAMAVMLADAVLTGGGRAGWRRVLLVRGALVASILLAVTLDFERLMFLLIILPVIVLFLAVFGTLGGMVGRRTGLPAASGLGLGLVLAWALGVTFPMFAA